MPNRTATLSSLALALLCATSGVSAQASPQARALGDAWVQLEMAGYARDWCIARAPSSRTGVQRAHAAWLQNSPKGEIEDWFRRNDPRVLEALRATTGGQRDAVYASFDRGFADPAGVCANFRDTFLASLNVERDHAAALATLREGGRRSALPAASAAPEAPARANRGEDPDLRKVAEILRPLEAASPLRYGSALKTGSYLCTHVQPVGRERVYAYAFELALFDDQSLRVDGVRPATADTPRLEGSLSGRYQYDDLNGALDVRNARGSDDLKRFLPSNGRHDSVREERRLINALRHVVDARGRSFIYGQHEYGSRNGGRLACGHRGAASGPSPQQVEQARADERIAARDRFRTAPDRGLRAGDIAAVVHAYRNEYTATGLQARESSVLLLKDGRAYLNLRYTPHDLDVDASARGEPDQWLRWRRSGKDYQITNAVGRWNELPGIPGVPARRNEKLDGTYTRGASAVIGNAISGSSAVSRWHYSFTPDGRFRYSRGTQTGGQITGGVTEVHGGSATSAPARTGRYRFVDYTLELRFDDGETIRAAAFFWDNTRDDLVIDGLTYTR